LLFRHLISAYIVIAPTNLGEEHLRLQLDYLSHRHAGEVAALRRLLIFWFHQNWS